MLGMWVCFVTSIIPELSQGEPGFYGLEQVNLFVPQCPSYNGRARGHSSEHVSMFLRKTE